MSFTRSSNGSLADLADLTSGRGHNRGLFFFVVEYFLIEDSESDWGKTCYPTFHVIAVIVRLVMIA